MRYRRKVIDIDAVQYTGTNLPEVQAFAGSAVYQQTWGGLVIQTPSGVLPLEIGDYVARNPMDPTDFYPVKWDKFNELYYLLE